jgi:hypothetical protein
MDVLKLYMLGTRILVAWSRVEDFLVELFKNLANYRLHRGIPKLIGFGDKKACDYSFGH